MGAFLMALRVRGETVAEITGAARLMRERMITVAGTAMGRSISSARAATATAPSMSRPVPRSSRPARALKIAKHGNRSVSSLSGASDVLAALGVKLDVPFETITRCVNEAGVGLHVGATAPPGHEALGTDPRRARHPHDLQPAGPDLQPGTGEAPDRRRVRRAWVEPIAEVLNKLGYDQPGSCTATMDSTS